MFISLIMLSVVLLSVSAAFAADDVVDAVAVDEITDDEPLAVDEDSQSLSEGEVVTKDNFYDYFDESGSLLANVTSSELTFKDDISDVGVNSIVLDRPIKITGENSTLDGISINIKSSDVIISGLTINQDNNTAAIMVSNASNVQIEKTQINFVAIEDADGFAIDADFADNLKLIDNVVIYVGTTNGYGINNGIRISNSNNASIKRNDLYFQLVSAPVAWAEIPSGSGNWVSSPVSEGMVIDSSKGVVFEDNEVVMKYIYAIGSYDTIYTVDFRESGDAVIKGNNITSKGHTYVYGIIISGENFLISNNAIESYSDIYYANGIDVEGPATGVVENNDISTFSSGSAYPIYSGMNGQPVSVNYTENHIHGESYFIMGMSLGEASSIIKNNEIELDGNYTTGVAFRGENIELYNNHIVLISSEVGNESIWEGFGVETVGVKVIAGNASLEDNVIATAGKGVYIGGTTYIADLDGNFINVVGNTDKDAYAIYVENCPILVIYENDIDYQGTTIGTGINNAIYIYNTTSPRVVRNKLNLDLVSCYVPWKEIPSGSGNWVSFPVSEGIVFKDSDDVGFVDNTVIVNYGDVCGAYDTIYAVDFNNCTDLLVYSNTINANGHSHIYGIIVSGENFNIYNNTINTASDNYYANGIDIEGPASGVVEKNTITTKGVITAYPIYSGMNGQPVSVNYTENHISGESYFIMGMSLGEASSIIENNEIDLDGNYTTGVAFRGDRIELYNNHIVLISSEVGNESIWEGFGVETVGVKVIAGNATIQDNVIASAGKGVYLGGTTHFVDLDGNFINVVGNTDKDAFAIYAEDVPLLLVYENDIDYQGTTNGTGINYGVYILNTTSTVIYGNEFLLELVSCYVPWKEIPSGSGNWVSFPISEGIVVEDSDDVGFVNNDVIVNYGDVCGAYDTIYAVDFDTCTDVLVDSNTINANGHTYIYGIIVSSENFTISNNTINTESDNYYANGIDIEGPASGVVDNNIISAVGVESAYPIYSGMNGQPVSVNYTDNDLYGKAYLVIGMSLGDAESYIAGNYITAKGNYTKGIASAVANLTVIGNAIESLGSNVGNESAWESFGVDTYGIKVVTGDVFIANNTIFTTGDYAIYLSNATTGSVADNDLTANNVGKNAIEVASNVAISGTGPNYKTIIIASDLTKAYGASTQFVATVLDENGEPVANREVILTKGNDIIDVATTNSKGVVKFTVSLAVGTYTVQTVFNGDNVYAQKAVTNKIVVNKAATKITASKKTFKVKTKTKKYTVTVKANNKALAKVKVTLKVNGKTYKATTNAKGKATFKITKLNKKGKYTALVKFAGNKSYKASSAKPVITVK